MRRWWCLAAAAIIGGPSLAQEPVIDATTVVVRGRVVRADGSPLADAIVSVDPGVAGMASSVRTDQQGAYQLSAVSTSSFPWVSVAMLGYRMQRRQANIQLQRDGAITLDFVMTEAVTALKAERIVAERPRPPRDPNGRNSSPGASEATLDRLSGLSGDLSGDLTAALGLIPGVTLVPNADGSLSASVVGLGPDQNAITLNGSDFTGSTLPRDGLLQTVRLTTYDPRVGRFGGLQVSSTVPSGSFLSLRAGHVTVDDPALQRTTATSASLGSNSQDVILSGTASGPLVAERLYYSTAIQVGRRSSVLASMRSLSTGALKAIGISRDSVDRLLLIADQLGLPVSVSGIPARRTALSGSAVARLDFTPNAQPMGDARGDVVYLLASGSWKDIGGLGGGPAALDSRMSQSSHRDGSVMLNYSPYLWSALSETQARLSLSDDHSWPYQNLPAVVLLLDSRFSDGAGGFAPLQLGGNGGSESRLRQSTLEASNETSWMTLDRAHKFNLYLDAETRRFDLHQSANRLGTFSYNSLQDLTDGRPASFVRTPTDQQSTGQTWQGVIAFSDLYYVSRKSRDRFTPEGNGLTVQYGVRVDAERFDPAPATNVLVSSIFGRRTDHVPNGVSVQPMLGFTWKDGVYLEESGPARFTDTRSRLDGGFRVYRGTLSPLSVDNVARQSGLSGALQRLLCVGPAVPIPDWRAYGRSATAVPDQCAGSAGSGLTESAPPVKMFAPEFAIPQSWRTELNWRWLFSGQLSGNVGATYTRNVSQADPWDLNFNGVRRLTLGFEDGRPVFVSPSSIDQSSGQVASTDSRVTTAFTQVTEVRSNLASTAMQLTAGLTYRYGTSAFVSSVAPNPPRFNATLRAWYSYSDSRSETRGFSGTTAGDPRETAWGRSAVPRHTIQVVLDANLDRWFRITASGRLSSGMPFTPLIGSDVNGDGYANDRAFVFDPSSTADPALRSGMSALMGSTSDQVTKCLRAQVSRIAAYNSCEGPWSATLGTIAVVLDPFRIGLRNRGSLALYVNNALGGLDQVLHGEKHLMGWGEPAYADPLLLNVRGFDARTNAFRYSVNPLFGTSTAYRNAFRQPFRLTVDLRLDLSRSLESQAIEGFVNHGVDGGPLTVGRLKASMLSAAGTFGGGEIDRILLHADSLRLNAVQRAQLGILKQRALAVRDSVYGALAEYLIAQGRNYESSSVRERWHADITFSIRSTFLIGTRVREMLTAEQLAWLRARRLTLTLEYSPDWLERTIRAPLLLPR